MLKAKNLLPTKYVAVVQPNNGYTTYPVILWYGMHSQVYRIELLINNTIIVNCIWLCLLICFIYLSVMLFNKTSNKMGCWDSCTRFWYSSGNNWCNWPTEISQDSIIMRWWVQNPPGKATTFTPEALTSLEVTYKP